MVKKWIGGSILGVALTLGGFNLTLDSAMADACEEIRFADVGWTDITATTAVATSILGALGYDTDVKVLSVPVTYTSMANGDIDVFLGNWMPTMEADIAPYRDAGEVEIVGVNLKGAKYTLAVNQSLADAGLRDFGDIAKFQDQLDGKIYGIEPGNDGNRIILNMIKDNAVGLGDFWQPGHKIARNPPQLHCVRSSKERLGCIAGD